MTASPVALPPPQSLPIPIIKSKDFIPALKVGGKIGLPVAIGAELIFPESTTGDYSLDIRNSGELQILAKNKFPNDIKKQEDYISKEMEANISQQSMSPAMKQNLENLSKWRSQIGTNAIEGIDNITNKISNDIAALQSNLTSAINNIYATGSQFKDNAITNINALFRSLAQQFKEIQKEQMTMQQMIDDMVAKAKAYEPVKIDREIKVSTTTSEYEIPLPSSGIMSYSSLLVLWEESAGGINYSYDVSWAQPSYNQVALRSGLTERGYTEVTDYGIYYYSITGVGVYDTTNRTWLKRNGEDLKFVIQYQMIYNPSTRNITDPISGLPTGEVVEVPGFVAKNLLYGIVGNLQTQPYAKEYTQAISITEEIELTIEFDLSYYLSKSAAMSLRADAMLAANALILNDIYSLQSDMDIEYANIYSLAYALDVAFAEQSTYIESLNIDSAFDKLSFMLALLNHHYLSNDWAILETIYSRIASMTLDYAGNTVVSLDWAKIKAVFADIDMITTATVYVSNVNILAAFSGIFASIGKATNVINNTATDLLSGLKRYLTISKSSAINYKENADFKNPDFTKENP